MASKSTSPIHSHTLSQPNEVGLIDESAKLNLNALPLEPHKRRVARKMLMALPAMTEQIADLLVHDLGAQGVAVVVEASHTCMTIRGVRKPGSVCVTSAMKGLFRSNISSRAEVMSLIYGNGNRAI